MIRLYGAVPARMLIGRRQLVAAARYFAMRSSRRAGVEIRDVSLVLQDDAASAEAHLAIMGVNGPTDVITQPYDPMPGEKPGIYGELFVNAQRAASLATARWPAAKELLLYIAHGMDHLSGADDLSPADRAKMRRRELKWILDMYAAHVI